jgi:hypothetical protein
METCRSVTELTTLGILTLMAMGLTIAQAAGYGLPTETTKVRFQVRLEGMRFVAHKVAPGQVFSEYYSFLCRFSLFDCFNYHPELVL